MCEAVVVVVAVLVAGLAPLGCQAGGAKFWHITDLHLDTQYSVYGNATNMCHQSNTSTSSSNTTTLGPVGNYSCDSPKLLIEGLLKAMQKIEPNPDFIVWTGDSAPHLYHPQPSLEYITNVTSWVFSHLNSLFPDTPIIPALGNHDSWPADHYPQSDNLESHESQYYHYYEAGGFKSHLGESDDARDTFLKCGYYTRTITNSKNTSMKFLSLNTNVYYYNNVTVSEDPCGQLDWINKTIAGLADNEKVFVIGHVPPGSFERNPGVSFFNFNNTVNADASLAESLERDYVRLMVHQDTYRHIHAHLYGHVHTDTFRLYLSRSGDDTVLGVGFLASSGTPMLGHQEGTNPGIRLFEYDDEDGTLLNYRQYGLKLDQLKINKINKPESKPVDTTRRRRRDLANPSPVQTSDQPPVQTSDQTPVKTSDETPVQTKKTIVTTAATPQADSVNNVEEDVTTIKPNNGSSKPLILGHKGENPTPTDDIDNVVVDPLVDEIASKFSLIYEAKDLFQVDNLTASEMGRAFNKMGNKTDNRKMFDQYYKHNTVDHLNGLGKCNETCFRNQMCTIKHSVIAELNACRLGNETLEVRVADDADWSAAAPAPVTAATLSSMTPEKSTTPPMPTTPGYVSKMLYSTLETTASTDTTASTAEPTPPPSPPVKPPSGGKRPPSRLPPTINAPPMPTPSKTQPEPTSDTGAHIAGVVLGAVGAIFLFAVCAIALRKYRQRRYRDQEFLLTDSVFRYDGYNQLDDEY